MYESPYAPPVIDNDLPETALGRVELPHHFARFLANLVDSFLSGIPAAIALVALLAGGMFLVGGDDMSPEDIDTTINVLSIPLVIVVYVGISLYYAAFESSEWMATPGKMLFGLKVVNEDGTRVPFGRAFARGLTKTVLLGMCSYFIAVMVFLDEDRRGPWGSLTNTRVLKPLD